MGFIRVFFFYFQFFLELNSCDVVFDSFSDNLFILKLLKLSFLHLLLKKVIHWNVGKEREAHGLVKGFSGNRLSVKRFLKVDVR